MNDIPEPTPPAPETHIQAGSPPPDAATPAVTAEAPSPTPKVARKPWFTATGADRFLVLLLLVLTFLLGSFAARNAEFLMDLATGRLIANGEYQFGSDPFAHGTTDAYWVNHSWLFDWLAYLIYSIPVIGGPGLILFKALLLVALALVMLAIRRPEQSLWVPVLCTGLAMVVVSQRTLMSSMVVSFLFLAITLYVLTRSKRVWILPLLFALWVNVDAWFVLGPLTLALYLLGSLGQRLAGQATRHCPGMLAVVLLAGLAACLVNPYTYRAFTLPPELAYIAVRAGNMLPSWMVGAGETVQELMAGEQDLHRSQQVYHLLWLSPLARAWRTESGLGMNIASLAYFPLLVLGLLSFVLPAVTKAKEFPWPRVLVWLFFAFLSLVLARNIAFFAVIAGPIMALNFQEYWTELWGGDTAAQPEQPAVLPRLATGLIFLAVIFLAWPGWLHARIYPFDFNASRRVAWHIRIDPSLEGAAERLGTLQKRGVIHNGFAFSPDVACYCAWFAPEVKGFIDYRYQLFADRAKAFARIKPALASLTVETRPEAKLTALKEWRDLAERFALDYLVVTNFSRGSNVTRLAAGSCWINPARWPWLYGDGRTLVFGWNPGSEEGPLQREGMSLDRLAFGTVPEAERAPGTGATLPEGPLNFWSAYLEGLPGPPLALDAAEQFQIYQQLCSDQVQRVCQLLSLWTAMHTPAALSGVLPWSVSLPVAALNMSIRPSVTGSPAAPVLSMREVRRALADNPLDPPAYETFAKAADMESRQEELWGRSMQVTFRRQMRLLQTVAAWKSYLTLKPDDFRAHQIMASIFFQRFQYYDISLEHLARAAKSWHPQAAATPEAQKQVEGAKKGFDDQFRALETKVRKSQEDFDLRATGMPTLQKVQLAFQYGLARRALQALQQANPNQLTQAESLHIVWEQLHLWLKLGEIHEVNRNLDYLKPARRQYHQIELQCAVIAGEYDRADAALREILRELPLQGLPVLTLTHLSLAPANLTFFHPLNRFNVERAYVTNLQVLMQVLEQAASWNLLRGILALERGDNRLARESFRKAVDLSSGIYLPERTIAENYLTLLQENR